MIEVRITSTGKTLPWWRDRVFIAEIGGARSMEQLTKFSRFVSELRHATMLEF